jgi:hypothetical protein
MNMDRRTFSRRAFLEASLIACFGACCTFLFLWYLDVPYGCCDDMPRMRDNGTDLVIIIITREVELCRDERQKGFKCLIVPFE